MPMNPMTREAAILILEKAAQRWSASDLCRLAHLATLGPASELANDPTPARVETGTDPGGVPTERRPSGPTEQLRADLLHTYRVAAPLCGHPMRAPGEKTT